MYQTFLMVAAGGRATPGLGECRLAGGGRDVFEVKRANLAA
jgi:hypothetical protein